MNTSHYPSIELCAKLTEIEFPKTEKLLTSFWIYNNNSNLDSIQSEVEYTCPSVLEILDNINLWSCYELIIKKQYDYDLWYCYNVEFKYIEGCTMKSFKWNYPDALAEMYIYLYKKRYIL